MKTFLRQILGKKKLGFENYHQRSSLRRFPSLVGHQKKRQTQFKAYARFPEKLLPRPAKRSSSLWSLLSGRRSCRHFTSKKLSLSQISELLFFSAGLNRFGYRMYPSAGARYPLELYILPLNADLEKHIYHYYVKHHSLEKLYPYRSQCWKQMFNQNWLFQAGVLVVVTAVFERTTSKYGSRGYRYILEEAGHLAQNFHLVAAALGLGCCAIGGYLDSLINQELRLETGSEEVVYVLALGEKKSDKF